LQPSVRAECSFLLAKFQLDHVLNYREPRKRLKALETVPKDMSSAYDEVMERIEKSRSGDKELAMNILSWILRAKRPLFMSELLEALAVEDGDSDLNRECILQPYEVIDCCKSLVIHDETSDSVRFTHFTVQEFIKSRIQQNLPSEIGLAKTCLTYLTFDTFDYFVVDEQYALNRMDKFKFSKYAAQFWALHIRGEAEKSSDVQKATLEFLKSVNKRNSMLQIEAYTCSRYGSASFTKRKTLLHVLAEKGLATIFSLYVDANLDIERTYCPQSG
jgi:hypothetical protein